MQKNAKLIVEGRENWVFSHSLGDAERVSIGRTEDNDVALGDAHSSKRHAEIIKRKNHYYLRDLGSRNGTVLNGKKILSETPLKDGDIIVIGSASMSFMADEDLDAADSGTRLTMESVHADADKAFQPMNDSLVELRSSLESMQNAEAVGSRLQDMEKQLAEAQNTIRRLTIINTFMGVLAAHPGDPTGGLRAGLKFLSEQIDADNAFIMEIDEKAKKWVVRASVGDMDDWCRRHSGETEAPLSLSLVEKAVKTKEPVIYRKDDEALGNMNEAVSIVKLGICSGMCFPISNNGKVRGVVYADYRKPLKKLRAEDQIICEMLSEKIAQTLIV